MLDCWLDKRSNFEDVTLRNCDEHFKMFGHKQLLVERDTFIVEFHSQVK